MQNIEQVLYTDPQCRRPAGTCPHCGGLVYAPGCRCSRCERGAL